MYEQKLKLLKFDGQRREKYSDNWLLKINLLAIAEYIQKRDGSRLSWRAARAIANAKILEVYRDLVLEEEQLSLQEETMEGEWNERK